MFLILIDFVVVVVAVCGYYHRLTFPPPPPPPLTTFSSLLLTGISSLPRWLGFLHFSIRSQLWWVVWCPLVEGWKIPDTETRVSQGSHLGFRYVTSHVTFAFQIFVYIYIYFFLLVSPNRQTPSDTLHVYIYTYPCPFPSPHLQAMRTKLW